MYLLYLIATFKIIEFNKCHKNISLYFWNRFYFTYEDRWNLYLKDIVLFFIFSSKLLINFNNPEELNKLKLIKVHSDSDY